MNYDKDIIIDESALDVEWLEQASLMMRYARHSAECRKRADEAKQALDVCKAETDRDIRENPDRYGINKVTEAAIGSAILSNDAYKVAFQTYLDTKFEADMAQGAVRAFDARKDALENLVRLHGQQYFAGPSVPHDLTKEWEQRKHQEKADDAVIIRRTRTK